MKSLFILSNKVFKSLIQRVHSVEEKAGVYDHLPLLFRKEDFQLRHRLVGCLDWDSDLTSGSSLHRVDHKSVLCSVSHQNTPGYTSSTCWDSPEPGLSLKSSKAVLHHSISIKNVM